MYLYSGILHNLCKISRIYLKYICECLCVFWWDRVHSRQLEGLNRWTGYFVERNIRFKTIKGAWKFWRKKQNPIFLVWWGRHRMTDEEVRERTSSNDLTLFACIHMLYPLKKGILIQVSDHAASLEHPQYLTRYLIYLEANIDVLIWNK